MKKEGDKNNYALEGGPLAEREAQGRRVKTVLELAQKLEGMTRNIGMHAGGVLIAPGKLTDFCPLYQQPGSDSAVSQYDKDDVEAIGLVKFDFLGLATLTILEIARELHHARHKGQENFAFENIPLDDGPTYKLFSDGKTEAVFQFESRGMQGMLRDAKPSRLEDLIALNALYRPGPMDLIPSFVAASTASEPWWSTRTRWWSRGAVRDLRHHGLPGAGDADRAGAGRLRWAAPTCCAGPWARKRPRKWPSTAPSSAGRG
jgi:DNA polymerase-3 subunit alpha